MPQTEVTAEEQVFGSGKIHAIPALCLCAVPALAGSGAGVGPADWTEVKLVFEKRCVNCHAEHGAAKALRLDSFEGTIAGSSDGAVVLPGNASQSELVRRLRGESTPRMPFLSTPLPEDELDLIVRWIDDGLPNGASAD